MSERPLTGSRILAVDDDEANLRVLRRLLERAGCTVETTSDPTQAAAIAARFLPALVLLDLNMPVMDGYAVLGALRGLEGRDGQPPPQVIVLSGEAPEESTVRCLQAGARDFVRKPFDVQDLLDRIAAVIASTRSPDESLYRR
jgi:CheY-like chemotaxis protein